MYNSLGPLSLEKRYSAIHCFWQPSLGAAFYQNTGCECLHAVLEAMLTAPVTEQKYRHNRSGKQTPTSDTGSALWKKWVSDVKQLVHDNTRDTVWSCSRSLWSRHMFHIEAPISVCSIACMRLLKIPNSSNPLFCRRLHCKGCIWLPRAISIPPPTPICRKD